MSIRNAPYDPRMEWLCRLAFDLNSAALALAAEAADIACNGLPLGDYDRRLQGLSYQITRLISDLEGGRHALRHTRLTALNADTAQSCCASAAE